MPVHEDSHILYMKTRMNRVFFLLENRSAYAPTMHRMGESLCESVGARAPTMYRAGESFFNSMGAWAPTTFSERHCEKSSFENHGCQGTHDIRTASFSAMYGGG